MGSHHATAGKNERGIEKREQRRTGALIVYIVF